MIDQLNDPTVETLYENTTRPKELLEELVEKQVSREYIVIREDDTLELTDSGQKLAAQITAISQ